MQCQPACWLLDGCPCLSWCWTKPAPGAGCGPAADLFVNPGCEQKCVCMPSVQSSASSALSEQVIGQNALHLQHGQMLALLTWWCQGWSCVSQICSAMCASQSLTAQLPSDFLHPNVHFSMLSQQMQHEWQTCASARADLLKRMFSSFRSRCTT